MDSPLYATMRARKQPSNRPSSSANEKRIIRRRKKVDETPIPPTRSVPLGATAIEGGGEQEKETSKPLLRRRRPAPSSTPSSLLVPDLRVFVFGMVVLLVMTAMVLFVLPSRLSEESNHAHGPPSGLETVLSNSSQQGNRPIHEETGSMNETLHDDNDGSSSKEHLLSSKLVVVLEDLPRHRYPMDSFQSKLPPLTQQRHHPNNDDGDDSILDMESLQFADPPNFVRKIPSNDWEYQDKQRHDFLKAIDHPHLDPLYYHWHDLPYPRDCVRPSWAYESHPVCNEFHQVTVERAVTNHTRPLLDYTVQYVAHGHYRDTWRIRLGASDSTPPQPDSVYVLKRLRLVDDVHFDHRMDHTIHSEALVFERLSSSPVVTDIYGHCGTSVAVEHAREVSHAIVPHLPKQKYRGRISQEDLDKIENPDDDGVQGYGVRSLNNWTETKKLDMLIQMVTALTEMHNYPGGVIVHDDVHPDQWLMNDKGDFLFNDVRNAVVLDWNVQKQEYCKYWDSHGGDLRAPEEYKGSYSIDERVDLCPVANMIFSVLTGLWPYYQQVDEDSNEATTTKGIVPYINPGFATRSLIEGQLVQLMLDLYKLQPHKQRMGMGQVLERLLETQRLYDAQQKEKKQQQERHELYEQAYEEEHTHDDRVYRVWKGDARRDFPDQEKSE